MVLADKFELGFMESIETQFEEVLSRKKALASKPRIFRLMPFIPHRARLGGFPLESPVL